MKEEYDIFEEQTCYALEYMGLPVRSEGAESENWGSDIVVGVIDKSESGKPDSSLYRRLSRPPLKETAFHGCKCRIRLSNHGIFCTSLIAAKSEAAEFFGLCRGRIGGVVPSCNIFTYAVGCEKCGIKSRSIVFLPKAIQQAIDDKVNIISMSIGHKFLCYRPETILGDLVGEKLLDAFKNGILACVSAGNKGPHLGSLGWGMPWCLNVGACTSGKIGVTKVEVGVKTTEDLDIPVISQENDMKIIGIIEGDSLNIFEHKAFCPLLIKDAKCEDSFLSLARSAAQPEELVACLQKETKHLVKDFHMTTLPQTKIFSEDSRRLWEWKQKFGKNVHVRMSTSKLFDDTRPPFVPNFSSRGPATPYKEIIMPNILAPGAAIVGTWSKKLRLTKSSTIWNLTSGQRLMTGTSCSCALAAGGIAYLMYCRRRMSLDDLSPSALISAVMTTAKDLGISNNTNEFDYGAGTMNIEKAVTPGLLYEETFEHMHLYRLGRLPVYDLNLPSFAAAFSRSHKCFDRVFRRRLTNDDEINENESIIYDSSIRIDHNFMDPRVNIEVQPSTLVFEHKGQVRTFQLVCQVHPLPRGYISGSLIWKARKFGESTREVKSRFILYEHGFLDKPVEKKPPKEEKSLDSHPKGASSSQKRAREDSPPQEKMKQAKR